MRTAKTAQPELLEKVQRLLSEDSSIGKYRVAKALGISERQALNAIKQVKSSDSTCSRQTKEHATFEESNNTGVASSLSREIRTLDDLLNFAGVDRSVWEVERYVCNKYEMGYTNAKGEANAKPLYQIKAWLKKMVVVERARSLISEMLKEFKAKSPKVKALPRKKGNHLLEVSIFDIHIGKLCWGPETGENYDVAIAQAGFSAALEHLIERSKSFPAERILFPIGNDLLNSDNAAQTTTAGTPQDEDGRWQRSFAKAKKTMVDGIMRLREVAPVDVLMVPGNHDRERVFYLGEVLHGWFNNIADVSIDNAPTMRKYYRYGQCLLGFTHGNEEKHTNLPLIMATEQSENWAASKFREFHVGHFHSKKDMHFFPTREFNGIRVRQIPSLCPPDAWHRLKGYEGLRAAEAYVWHKDEGCVGSFSFTP